MTDTVLFLGWNGPRTGRESHSLELFNSTLTYWKKQVEKGNIESFEPVILTRHGGDMNGFILVRGERDKLNELKTTDEFLSITTQATYCLDGFGMIEGFIGDGLMRVMNEYGRWASKG